MTVTSKRQITLPKDLMDALGVEKGDRLVAKKRGKKFVLERASKGVLSFIGGAGKLDIPKGHTVDDVIHDATEEFLGKNIR